MKVKIEMPLEAYSQMRENKGLAKGLKNTANELLTGDTKETIVGLADIYVDLAEAIEECIVKEDKDD